MMSAMTLISTTSALVGYQLAPDKSYATLPFAAVLIATMLTSIPAAKLLQYIGRKLTAILASFIGMARTWHVCTVVCCRTPDTGFLA